MAEAARAIPPRVPFRSARRGPSGMRVECVSLMWMTVIVSDCARAAEQRIAVEPSARMVRAKHFMGIVTGVVYLMVGSSRLAGVRILSEFHEPGVGKPAEGVLRDETEGGEAPPEYGRPLLPRVFCSILSVAADRPGPARRTSP